MLILEKQHGYSLKLVFNFQILGSTKKFHRSYCKRLVEQTSKIRKNPCKISNNLKNLLSS